VTATDIIDWHDGVRVAATCSVCGTAADDVELVLSVHDAAPPHVLRHLHRCGDCHSLFMLPRDRVAYENAEEAGFSIKFYAEKGAGIDVMLGPLARVPFTAATRYLEIGCSFGFSLDFLGWRHGLAGTGIDPSPLAAAGRQHLGLNILSGYFDAGMAERLGPQDVIYCSELIEHVDDPAAFLRVAAAGLAPDGMLILTTPSVHAVGRDVDPTTVLAALSPGAHLAIFSRDGLQRLLAQAGLHHQVIEEGPETTLVWARAAAPPALVDAPADMGPVLGDYFEDRLGRHAGRPALAAGFLYRAFKQRMITADPDRAAALLPALRDFFRATYAVDLDAPETWPAPDGRDVRAFIDHAPLNLPVVANHLGVWLLNHGHDPAAAARTLVAAGRLARDYRDILAREHIADGELNATITDAARAALLALCQIPPGDDGWVGPAIAAVAAALDQDATPAVRLNLARLARIHQGDDGPLLALAQASIAAAAAGDAAAAATAIDAMATLPHDGAAGLADGFAAGGIAPETVDASGRLAALVRFLTGLGLHRCNGPDAAATRATTMQALAWYALMAGHAPPAAPLPPPAGADHADLQAGLVDLLVGLARQNLALGGDIEGAGAILLACRDRRPADCDGLLALQGQLLADRWIARLAAAPDATAAAETTAALAADAARPEVGPAVDPVFRHAVFTGQYQAAEKLAPRVAAAVDDPAITPERLPLLVAWAFYLLNGRRDYAAARALLGRIEAAGASGAPALGDWAGPVASALAIAQAA